MNSCDTGLNLEHCLQLCRQVHKLQVRGSGREGMTCLPLGSLSDGLQRQMGRFKLSFALLGHT